MTPAERRELEHITITTRDGSYCYREGAKLLDGLLKRGLIERQPRGEDNDTYFVYRVTAAGLDALESEGMR